VARHVALTSSDWDPILVSRVGLLHDLLTIHNVIRQQSHETDLSVNSANLCGKAHLIV